MSIEAQKHVTVVDYGGSNILSVVRALRHCGADVALTNSPGAIEAATRLVLPGVGAFGDVQAALAKRDLIAPIRDYAKAGRPFLGICVGMQLMMDYSEEFGRHPGLGLIPGGVKPIPPTGVDGTAHRIPHVGWQALSPAGQDDAWSGTVLDGMGPEDAVYFVHSFAAEPDDKSFRLAECFYDGLRISAAIGRGSVVGCQFHPEKSGPVGLRVLRNFLDIPPGGASGWTS